jgi:homoaconitate hydratase
VGATVVERIARAHMTDGPGRPLRPGDMVSLRPRHILTHDNTTAVMSKFRALGVGTVHDRGQPVIVLDHDVQNRSAENLGRYDAIRRFCRDQGLDFHPAGTGIGHQIIMERGYALPGTLVVASDSHANTYGAVGALGTPVVRTDAAVVWATGEFWWEVPPTVQVVLEGELRPGVTGKDLILTLCALYGTGEVLNCALEFAGPGVASLDMAARMTVANMTTEWGALTGWFPVDARTVAYLKERKVRLEAAGHLRITDAQLFAWASHPPRPDPAADYAARITVRLQDIAPFLTGPDTVRCGRPVAEAEVDGIAIQKAYLLSCVNGRLEDLAAAAAVLRGRQVADGVAFYVAAASREIQERAKEAGIWSDLVAAGARPLPPGCGPCIGLGSGLLEPGEVGISATNRNFRGRMGARDARVYLASPAVVASSAAAGRITDGGVSQRAPSYSFERLAAAPDREEAAAVVPGFPARVTGRLVFIPRDDLNTDGIYGKDHTYRDLSPSEMAAVVMANHDPSFAGRIAAGDVLVGGHNFGTGSSREQAVTALQAAGIALLIAGSLNRTYQRNAYNNGFVCLECPALVRSLWETLPAGRSPHGPTIIPGDAIEVDFRSSTIRWRDHLFSFPRLGPVAQALVAAGGAEHRARERLGLSTSRS